MVPAGASLECTQTKGEDGEGHKPSASGLARVQGSSQIHRSQAVKKTDEQMGRHCGPQEFHH